MIARHVAIRSGAARATAVLAVAGSLLALTAACSGGGSGHRAGAADAPTAASASPSPSAASAPAAPPPASPPASPSTTAGGGAAAVSPVAVSAGATGAPGSATATGPTTHLVITGAELHTAPDGADTLSMTVRNLSSVEEQLAMVAVPNGPQATLVGVGDDNGSLSGDGIELNGPSTTAFGSAKGPQVRFSGLTLPAGTTREPLNLEFGVAGLVHLDAVVVAG